MLRRDCTPSDRGRGIRSASSGQSPETIGGDPPRKGSASGSNEKISRQLGSRADFRCGGSKLEKRLVSEIATRYNRNGGMAAVPLFPKQGGEFLVTLRGAAATNPIHNIGGAPAIRTSGERLRWRRMILFAEAPVITLERRHKIGAGAPIGAATGASIRAPSRIRVSPALIQRFWG